MRIFMNVWFSRFARKEKISPSVLREAIARANKGSIDAELGGSVIKQRIPRKGRGKSGGYRSIIFFRKGHVAFFVYGFAKKDRDNIDAADVAAYRTSAKELLALSDQYIEDLLKDGTLEEVL